MPRDQRLQEYAGWVQKLSVKHDVGFTLSPDSTIEALRWLINEVHQLEYLLQQKEAYVKELERSFK